MGAIGAVRRQLLCARLRVQPLRQRDCMQVSDNCSVTTCSHQVVVTVTAVDVESQEYGDFPVSLSVVSRGVNPPMPGLHAPALSCIDSRNAGGCCATCSIPADPTIALSVSDNAEITLLFQQANMVFALKSETLPAYLSLHAGRSAKLQYIPARVQL